MSHFGLVQELAGLISSDCDRRFGVFHCDFQCSTNYPQLKDDEELTSSFQGPCFRTFYIVD